MDLMISHSVQYQTSYLVLYVQWAYRASSIAIKKFQLSSSANVSIDGCTTYTLYFCESIIRILLTVWNGCRMIKECLKIALEAKEPNYNTCIMHICKVMWSSSNEQTNKIFVDYSIMTVSGLWLIVSSGCAFNEHVWTPQISIKRQLKY